MKVFYDFEFIEDGKTIEPISVGMVDEDGNELYLINAELNLRKLARQQWLVSNVVPHLPMSTYVGRGVRSDGTEAPLTYVQWNFEHPDGNNVHTLSAIRERVRHFLVGRLIPRSELWAWYGAYDHVALAQLFGPMSAFPSGIPMWTNNLRQVVHMSGKSESDLSFPANAAEHRAIDDARWNKAVYEGFVTAGLVGG